MGARHDIGNCQFSGCSQDQVISSNLIRSGQIHRHFVLGIAGTCPVFDLPIATLPVAPARSRPDRKNLVARVGIGHRDIQHTGNFRSRLDHNPRIEGIECLSVERTRIQRNRIMQLHYGLQFQFQNVRTRTLIIGGPRLDQVRTRCQFLLDTSRIGKTVYRT